MDDILVIFLIMVLLPTVFVVAKYQDKMWRIKFMRERFPKKDYHLLELVSKDRRSKKLMIVLPSQATVWINGKVWALVPETIYRTDNPTVVSSQGIRIYNKNKKEDGFFVEKITHNEGVPVITIDEASFRPVDYDYKSPTKANAGEAGAILKGWVVNEEMKARISGFKDVKNLQIICIGALLFSLAAAGVGYMGYSEAQATHTDLNKMNATLNEVHDYFVPSKLSNATSYPIINAGR